MSKSSTKTSSTSTATNNANTSNISNSTTTPTVAPWLSQSYQGFNDLISKYATTDPSSYVTGPTANQTAAFGSAGTLGSGQNLINQGAGIAGGIAGQGPQGVTTATYNPGSATAAQTSQADIDRFLNPYLQNVVDSTLTDYDVNSGRTRAAQSAQAAKNGAFGGSRYAIREAQTEGELSRGRTAADASLRSGAYDRALAAAQQETDRRQQAALTSYTTGANAGMVNAGAQNQTSQFNAGLQGQNLDRSLSAAGLLGNFGTAMDANQRANIGAQLDLGNAERDINQEQANALPEWLKNLSSLYGSIPIGSFTSLNQSGTDYGTSTGTSTGSQTGTSKTSSLSISDAAKAAQMAAMFSDVRLKENIEYSDTDDKGRNWYNYNYIWEDSTKRRRGVMAQEVIKTDPQSVIKTRDGFLMVDYGTLR
jgi:Chaperone of endosialidase